ncbi:hypothetical protein AA313_de0202223 [Arthrobotrys entomopaga]|nr:hypothetical protein AA313_de0202223 [Arthrobotrys entomopaga]
MRPRRKALDLSLKSSGSSTTSGKPLPTEPGFSFGFSFAAFGQLGAGYATSFSQCPPSQSGWRPSGAHGVVSAFGSGGSGLFGNPAASTGVSLFGSSSNARKSGGGPFGSSENAPAASSGLFGSSVNDEAAGTGLFAAPKLPPTGGLFASSQSATSNGKPLSRDEDDIQLVKQRHSISTNFFGAPKNAPTSTSSLFDTPIPFATKETDDSSITVPNTGGNLFGAPVASAASGFLGSSNPKTVFGSPSTNPNTGLNPGSLNSGGLFGKSDSNTTGPMPGELSSFAGYSPAMAVDFTADYPLSLSEILHDDGNESCGLEFDSFFAQSSASGVFGGSVAVRYAGGIPAAQAAPVSRMRKYCRPSASSARPVDSLPESSGGSPGAVKEKFAKRKKSEQKISSGSDADNGQSGKQVPTSIHTHAEGGIDFSCLAQSNDGDLLDYSEDEDYDEYEEYDEDFEERTVMSCDQPFGDMADNDDGEAGEINTTNTPMNAIAASELPPRIPLTRSAYRARSTAPAGAQAAVPPPPPTEHTDFAPLVQNPPRKLHIGHRRTPSESAQSASLPAQDVFSSQPFAGPQVQEDSIQESKKASPKPVVKVSTPDERIHSLIMLQSFAGSFVLNDDIATVIKNSFKTSGDILQKLKDLAAKVGISEGVLATWAAILVFENGEGHASERDTWELVVEKAVMWLDSEGKNDEGIKSQVASVIGA